MEKTHAIRDEYCRKIFVILTLSDEKIRFNQLHKKLDQYNLKMTKPTLLLHLSHLIKQKIVKRTVPPKQKQVVYYQLNWKALEQLQKARNINEKALHYMIDEKTFKSKPLREQIHFTIDLLCLKEILTLELCALYIIKPKQRLGLLSTLSYINLVYTLYAKWLFSAINQSKEKGQELLEAIKENVDILTKPFVETNE
jgi:DNA-binding HxlR family transcriptional regulator